MLAKSILVKIDGALEASPCARCGKPHRTKHCPMNPGSGGGSVWTLMPKASRPEADAYLRGLEGFVGDISGGSGGSGGGGNRGNDRPNWTGGRSNFGGPRPMGGDAGASRGRGIGANNQGRGRGQSYDVLRGMPAQRGRFAPRAGRSNYAAFNRGGYGHQTFTQSSVPIQQYLEANTKTGMHYPTIKTEPVLPQTNGSGKPWRNTNSSSQLSKFKDPLYPLRESFFTDRPDRQVILTNHFEYKLTTEKLYEYRILDFGTTNRRRIRQLFEDAINDWPFLRDNKDYFATNYIDTIVSWKSLHTDLPKSEKNEWAKYIPTTNRTTADNTTANNSSTLVCFRFIGSFNAAQLTEYASANPNHVNVNFENIARCLNIGPVSPPKAHNGVPVTESVRVIDHLQAVFGQRPISGRPAVNVGTVNKPIWYAQEHLRIVPYQPYNRAVPDRYTRSMVDQACRDPQVSRALIENEGLWVMGFNVGDTSTRFGADIPVQLTPAMLQVPHRTLPFPITQYRLGKGCRVPVPGSRWKLYPDANWCFLQPTSTRNLRYAIILGPRVNEADREEYDSRLRRELGKLDIDPWNSNKIDFDDQLTVPNEEGMCEKLRVLKEMSGELHVVFLLLDRADKSIYRDFKNAADRIYPIQSVCITKKNAEREIYTNVMMKVNLKLKGINHSVKGVSEWLKNTMVIGADLIHPSPGAFAGTPSIAAVVGSVDKDGGKCLGSLRLQGIDKTDREIIDAASLEEMVLDRLDAWSETKGENELPTNIIYYRDGVSSGHYSKVQETELKAIRDAYRAARMSRELPEEKLNLAAIIVTKRHHTRFYPQDPNQGDKSGNMNTNPGTYVDQLVTSPYYQDFFLQSHSSIKGTARPTHYFVLHNEIPDLTLDKLRDLVSPPLPLSPSINFPANAPRTHRLCYSYVRSMCAVSYASPTYYADRLCKRGRLYIRNYYNGDNDAHKSDLDQARKIKVKEQREAREKEFGKRNANSKAEREREKEHRDALRNHLREMTLSKVKAAFYNQPLIPIRKGSRLQGIGGIRTRTS